jgi:hypothetical protein
MLKSSFHIEAIEDSEKKFSNCQSPEIDSGVHNC